MMTQPVPVRDIDCLEIAAQIGFYLARRAIRAGDRCTWLDGALTFPGQNPLVSRTVAADLYGGVTGIGWFLAELAIRVPDAVLRSTALAALTQGAARASEIGEHGFYGGRAGVGAGLVTAGLRLGDAGTVEAGRGLLLSLSAEARRPDETDLIGGLGGSVLAFAIAGAALEDDLLLDRAMAAAVALIAMGVPGAGNTLSWPSMPDTRANLTGFAHGTAGIAYALLVLDARRPDPALRSAAAAALVYEDACFDRARGGWPDYRRMPGQPQDVIHYPVAWCHGAAGIGQMRAAVSPLGIGDPAAMDHALEATIGEAMRLLALPATDMTLCHGLLGLVDPLIDAARRGHAGAMAVLTTATRRAADFHGTESLWLSGLPSREECSGLLLGTAGIGWFFLRLTDAGPGSILMPGANLLARSKPSQKSVLETG